jgi:hypothetical protein
LKKKGICGESDITNYDAVQQQLQLQKQQQQQQQERKTQLKTLFFTLNWSYNYHKKSDIPMYLENPGGSGQ